MTKIIFYLGEEKEPTEISFGENTSCVITEEYRITNIDPYFEHVVMVTASTKQIETALVSLYRDGVLNSLSDITMVKIQEDEKEDEIFEGYDLKRIILNVTKAGNILSIILNS